MAVTYQVPLSYTVNVSLSATPSGLADFNTNSIAIFTNEPAAFSDSYEAYITPAAVESDFGSSSLTYKMAQALFTPVPNFRSGGGYLYIFPFNGADATAATLTTPNITSNVTAFKSITDGSLSITIDSENYLITGMNFSSVNNVADIVKVLKSKGLDAYIEADSGSIRFTSKRFGTASGVVISAQSTAVGTDIATSAYLDASNGASVAGTDSSGETLAEAVTRALQQVYFGGVLSTQSTEDDVTLANSSALQSKDIVFYNNMASLADMADLGAAIKAAGNGKTRTIAYSEGAEASKIAAATYATIAQSVNYEGSNTALTMNLKQLTGLVGDSGLSDTYVLSANTNGVDIYGLTGGLSCVYSNDNNGYTDDITANLWHKKATEVAGFNYLRQTNTKIPQTESGMTGLKNAYAQVCERAIRNGTIAPGAWNTAIPFGDPEDFKRNIEEKGYYIYSIPVAEQSQTEREARKAPLVQIALKRSGAFHFSEVLINVER